MRPLSHEFARQLMDDGYNILEADRELPDPNAVLTAKRIENIDEYLDKLDEDRGMVIAIDDYLNWPENDFQNLVVTG